MPDAWREDMPGYVDKLSEKDLDLTVFRERVDFSPNSKLGTKVRVAPAGVDRKPTAPAVTGSMTAAKMAGYLCKVSVTLGNS